MPDPEVENYPGGWRFGGISFNSGYLLCKLNQFPGNLIAQFISTVLWSHGLVAERQEILDAKSERK